MKSPILLKNIDIFITIFELRINENKKLRIEHSHNFTRCTLVGQIKTISQGHDTPSGILVLKGFTGLEVNVCSL